MNDLEKLDIILNKTLSTEYTSFISQLVNKKNKVDISTADGLKKHNKRNEHQFKLAPKDLKTMLKFVKNGWFYNEGLNPCHNINPSKNTPEARAQAVKDTVLIRKGGNNHKYGKGITQPLAPLGNLSFRGTANTPFEGCQFIYNCKTGKLVSDPVNKGTYDFGHYGTPGHYVLDIVPWIKLGNAPNGETSSSFFMPKDKEKYYLTHKKDGSEIKDKDNTDSKESIIVSLENGLKIIVEN